MKIGRKLKVPPPGQNFEPERQRSIQNEKKITILSKNFAISGSFDETTIKNGQPTRIGVESSARTGVLKAN